MEKVAIVIPTRNRPEELRRFLSSLLISSIQPSQVVIVSSGMPINYVIEEFLEKLPITYQHSEVVGQVAQKRIAIEHLAKDIDWCIFSDDDLLVGPNAIANAFREIEVYGGETIVGIGFSLPTTSRYLNFSPTKRFFAKAFILDSDKPGKVLASGHASSYLQQKENTKTDWLNGVSMWRARFARQYGRGMSSSQYAACEDLIFSYSLNKIGDLLYVPSAKFDFQDGELSDFDGWKVFCSASLWRYFFVCKNNELSIIAFLWSQLFRTVYVITKTNGSRVRLIKQMFILNSQILWNALIHKKPEVLINRLLNGNFGDVQNTLSIVGEL